MELVSILSTIILFITTATTILAVCAYVLYKVRERKARANRRLDTDARPTEPVLVVATPPVEAVVKTPVEAAVRTPVPAPQAVLKETPPRANGNGAPPPTPVEEPRVAARPVSEPAAPADGEEDADQKKLLWRYTHTGY